MRKQSCQLRREEMGEHGGVDHMGLGPSPLFLPLSGGRVG